MRKLVVLVSALTVLLTVTGIASASSPVSTQFTIDGITTSVQPWLPNPPDSGPLSGLITADGTVTGEFVGAFSFQEAVIFNPTSGQGPNRGNMTITTDNGDVFVMFGGQTDGLRVEGQFTVVAGTGDYTRLRGRGIYEGNADICNPIPVPPVCLGFSVTFTGSFHSDPQ